MLAALLRSSGAYYASILLPVKHFFLRFFKELLICAKARAVALCCSVRRRLSRSVWCADDGSSEADIVWWPGWQQLPAADKKSPAVSGGAFLSAFQPAGRGQITPCSCRSAIRESRLSWSAARLMSAPSAPPATSTTRPASFNSWACSLLAMAATRPISNRRRSRP